jgi:hypothetical protein
MKLILTCKRKKKNCQMHYENSTVYKHGEFVLKSQKIDDRVENARSCLRCKHVKVEEVGE